MANSNPLDITISMVVLVAIIVSLFILPSLFQQFFRQISNKTRHNVRRHRDNDFDSHDSNNVKTHRPHDWDEVDLNVLEWKRFEILTREFLKALGFQAELTRVGPDGGVDVILRKHGECKIVGAAQCKAWKSDKYVGVKEVRELYGVMAADGIPHGVFVTTSEFTEDAQEFAKYKPLELVSGNKLLHFIKQLPQSKQDSLFDSVFSGDYTTPTCVNCDVKMVKRTARKGRDAGREFWGCPNYPRCHTTLNMK